MDAEGKQSFFSALPASLETVCNLPSGLQDDTILHRMLDLIKHLVVSPEDVTSSGLITFLTTVTGRLMDVHTSVVVLALGTAAHLVSVPRAGHEVLKTAADLFDAVQVSGTLSSSSVGAAYFNRLATYLSVSQAGLEHLVQGHKTHVQTALNALETARSIFVLNAVENFLVSVVTHALEMDKTRNAEKQYLCSLKTVSHILEYLDRVLAEMTKEKVTVLDQLVMSSDSHTLHLSAVQIIRQLCDSKAFCQMKVADEQFMSVLVHLTLHHPTDKIWKSALQSLVNICDFMRDARLLTEKLLPPLLKLMSDGQVERGINIAAAFCNSQHIDTEPMLILRALQQLPREVLFSGQTTHPQFVSLVPAMTTALGNHQILARQANSLLQSLKQTENSGDLARLLQSTSAVREDPDWMSHQSSWPQSLGTSITGNARLLNSLLQFLHESDSLVLQGADTETILHCLLNIMGRPQVDSRLFSQTSGAFLTVLKSRCQQGTISEDFGMEKMMGRLMTLMERSMVSMQWEIRDSALEFISQLITMVYQGEWLQGLFLEHHILHQAWTCLEDGESYPRASAIAMATRLHQTPGWWHVFLADCATTEMAVVKQMVEVLSAPESLQIMAPPTGPFHREAVQLLSAIYQHTVSTESDTASGPSWTAQVRQVICAALLIAVKDADWEVKVKALEFWEILANPCFKIQDEKDDCIRKESDGSIHGAKSSVGTEGSKTSVSGKHKHTTEEEGSDGTLLTSLIALGLEEALFTGAEDCDSSVSEKACQILFRLQRSAELDRSPSKKPNILHSFEQSGSGDGPYTVDNLCQTTQENDSDDINPFMHAATDNESTVGCMHKSNNFSDVGAVKKFLVRVQHFNPAEKLQKLAASIDEYDCRPVSLLEDVMAAAKLASAAAEAALSSEDEFDNGEDIFLDCY